MMNITTPTAINSPLGQAEIFDRYLGDSNHDLNCQMTVSPARYTGSITLPTKAADLTIFWSLFNSVITIVQSAAQKSALKNLLTISRLLCPEGQNKCT